MSLSPARAPLLLSEVEEFLLDPELGGDRERRLAGAVAQIHRTGTYEHTTVELAHGARVAWRNHARCVGRAAWRSLRVVDRRDRTTGEEVVAELVEHLESATNGGRIRPTVTIFAPGWHIHNEQLVRYAGWTERDGSVLGDPRNVATTDLALSLGWAGPTERGAFDVLPIILSGPGHPPQTYDLPAAAVLEVPLRHPDYDWFAELGLRWHALPAISNMSLSIGGLEYSLAPFNGWYVSAEIGARNFGDDHRYAMLAPVAERMGLDMSSPTTMWRAKAMIELVDAVRHSFDAAGVTIVSWEKVERQFMAWHDRLAAAGAAPPTNRDWMLNPIAPTAGSAFQRTFNTPDVRPNFYHHDQAPPTMPSPATLQVVRDD